jgi:hypothetical protein
LGEQWLLTYPAEANRVGLGLPDFLQLCETALRNHRGGGVTMNVRSAVKIIGSLALGLVSTGTAQAQTVASVQSPARPLGLPVHGPVYEFASDDRSADYYVNIMPNFLDIVEEQLAERVEFLGREGFKLDASRLLLRTESDKPIRIYFLYEAAGYHNTLGYAMTPAGAPSKGSQYVVFPDASMKGGTTRTTTEPLKIGDWVEIGSGGNGYQLDFFLISNGANGGKKTLWNDPNANVDGLQHMVAFLVPGSRYILLGFEDIIGGGDLDYNDSLFVVDIGEVNAQNLYETAGTLPH